jgi:hypothetical protein
MNKVLPSRLYERVGRRKSLASPEAYADGAMTWGAMRSHHTLDSAVSGGITGSVLNTWKRSYLSWVLQLRIESDSMVLPLGGTRGTFTGLTFGSVFCTLGQLLYNEFGVQRIKFISRRYPIPSEPPTRTPIVLEASEPPAPKQPLLDRIIHAMGLNRLSNEEYLVRLREERAAYLRRIADLEAQLEEEKNSKHP